MKKQSILTQIFEELQEYNNTVNKENIPEKILNELKNVASFRTFIDREEWTNPKYVLVILKNEHANIFYEITKEQFELFSRWLKR